MNEKKIVVFCIMLFAPLTAGAAAPLTFSAVENRAVRDTSAVVLWHTEREAKGYLEYGVTTSYENSTLEEDLAYFHALKLAGLSSGTLYHYRIHGKDSSGNETVSGDQTFTTAAAPISSILTGDSPNPAGTTVIDEDTVWSGLTVTCSSNVTVGSASGQINFTIRDSVVTVNGKWTMGGNTPVNFKLENSEIIFNVTGGQPAPVHGGILDPNKIMEIYEASDINKPSRIEFRDSTIRGTSYQLLAWGVKLNSGGAGAKHTLCVDNVTFKHMGGLYGGGYGAYPLCASGSYAPDTKLINITIYECGKGVTLSNGSELAVDYVTAIRGWAAFIGGSDWQHLAMHKTKEGLYDPADGGWVRNGWFDADETKFNMMMCSNVIFENNTVILAAFNAGDGQYVWQGNTNTLRNNTFIQTGVGSRMNGTKIINNTFDRGMPTGGGQPLRVSGIGFIVSGNYIYQGGTSIIIEPYSGYDYRTGNHLISDNVFDNAIQGIYVNNQYNNIFSSNTIKSTRWGVPTYPAIAIYNSNTQLFRDTKIYSTAGDDIKLTNNTDTKFINTMFNKNKVNISNSNFNNYYYADVYVTDMNGVKVASSTVTIINEINISSYQAINIKGEERTAFVTGSDGHTSLPADELNSIAILDFFQTSTTEQQMTYTVAAEKDGVRASVSGINPDESWYRPDPNIPLKTVTIVLPKIFDPVDSGKETDEVKVYPNPYVKGKSGEKITFANLPKQSVVRIYALSGELLKEIKNESSIDGEGVDWEVNEIGSGVYLYVITSAAGVKKGKVSIVK